jgi:hypothetical protein
MKIRLMLQRTVQPPIDTPASKDYKSFVFDVLQQEVLDYLNGMDCQGCGVSIDCVGIEINPKVEGV